MKLTDTTSLVALATYVEQNAPVYDRTAGTERRMLKTRYGRGNAYVTYDGQLLRIELPRNKTLTAEGPFFPTMSQEAPMFLTTGGMGWKGGVMVRTMADLVAEHAAQTKAFLGWQSIEA